jgi:cellulose biosynthesis protein BcsQ
MPASTFAALVGYLFTCAGYTVEDAGTQLGLGGVVVGLHLFADASRRHLLARVEAHQHRPDRPLDAATLAALGEPLRERSGDGVPGFVITTSVFGRRAYDADREGANDVTFLDRHDLLRYITYVYGSRAPQADGRVRLAQPLSPLWLRMADSVRRPDPRVTRVLTIANNKGGVGKTVTALELGIGLARRGLRVLLLDLDGQGSLSLALPSPQSVPQPLETTRPHFTPPKSATQRQIAIRRATQLLPPPLIDGQRSDLSQFFALAGHPASERVALSSLASATVFERLWLIPAGRLVLHRKGAMVRSSLHRMDLGGGAHPQDELAFVMAIGAAAEAGAPDGHPYDWIILDTPPAQSHYTRAALAAAHGVLVCVGVDVFAAQAISALLDTADAMRALMGGGTAIAGALLTRLPSVPKPALRDARQWLVGSLELQGVRLLGEIPHDDKVDLTNRNAVRGGVMGTVKSLFGYSSSPAASAYTRLIDLLVREAPSR